MHYFEVQFLVLAEKERKKNTLHVWLVSLAHTETSKKKANEKIIILIAHTQSIYKQHCVTSISRVGIIVGKRNGRTTFFSLFFLF